MNTPRLETVIQDLKHLPNVPIVTARLLDLMDTSAWNPKAVTDLTSYDPALAIRLLRLANTAFYGLPQRITTIGHAVACLGHYTIQRLVHEVSLAQQGEHHPGLLDPNVFSQYSYGCALCCRFIGKCMSLQNLWDIFVAGLLHDIGYLVIGQHFAAEFAQVVQQFRTGDKSMVDLEIEIIGASHGQIGARLMEHWKLPAVFQAVAQYHDRPATAPTYEARQIAGAVALAEAIHPMPAAVFGINCGPRVFPRSLLEMLHLEEGDCHAIQRDLEIEMENIGEMFNV